MSRGTMRRTYTQEFKIEAVRLSRRPDLTVTQAARDLGIAAKLLYRWRSDLAAEPAEAFPGKGRRRAADQELERLRRENEQLRLERDILKKATAFFANQQP